MSAPKPRIFIDGHEGTTGLRIHDRLAARSDIALLEIASDKRKDTAERKRLLNAADLVFLCLPDAASREAVSLIDNPTTRVIDASTAFRTDPAWVYGLPELDGLHGQQRELLHHAARVANPGCHATAFILAVRPLVSGGLLPADAPLTAISLTGYSGAGKKMIAAYEHPDAPATLRGPRPYALTLRHKHLPEMQMWAGLTRPPLFTPVIANVHSGMAVKVFLPAGILAPGITAAAVHHQLLRFYAGEPFIRVHPPGGAAALDDGYFDITAANNTNNADLFVFGDDTTPGLTLLTRIDNLGKGASGAAIQNMNLMLGLPETTGLV